MLQWVNWVVWDFLYFVILRTLKHTKREKGMVTTTKPQESMVSIQPQRPMPWSDSSAEMDKTDWSKICRYPLWAGLLQFETKYETRYTEYVSYSNWRSPTLVAFLYSVYESNCYGGKLWWCTVAKITMKKYLLLRFLGKTTRYKIINKMLPRLRCWKMSFL